MVTIYQHHQLVQDFATIRSIISFISSSIQVPSIELPHKYQNKFYNKFHNKWHHQFHIICHTFIEVLSSIISSISYIPLFQTKNMDQVGTQKAGASLTRLAAPSMAQAASPVDDCHRDPVPSRRSRRRGYQPFGKSQNKNVKMCFFLGIPEKNRFFGGISNFGNFEIVKKTWRCETWLET